MNLYNSVTIIYKLLKFGAHILDVLPEGTVSKILYLGPSSLFFYVIKMILKIFAKYIIPLLSSNSLGSQVSFALSQSKICHVVTEILTKCKPMAIYTKITVVYTKYPPPPPKKKNKKKKNKKKTDPQIKPHHFHPVGKILNFHSPVSEEKRTVVKVSEV